MAAQVQSFVTRNSSPPASTVPSIYDTYLCKELSAKSPVSETELDGSYETCLRTLQSSAGYFLKQDRMRAVERLQFETARVYMQEKQWGNALRVMKPLWQTLSWRQAGWWHLVGEVNWALRECARMVGDSDTLIAVEWELLSKTFAERPNWQYDFSNSLSGLKPFDARPKAFAQTGKIISCLTATFAFFSAQTFVGEKTSSQIVFGGRLKDVRIQHDPKIMPEATSKDKLVLLYDNMLRNSNAVTNDTTLSVSEPTVSGAIPPSQFLPGLCDLTFTPGITKAISFDILPRESGDLEAMSVTLCVEGSDFDFEIMVANSDLRHQNFWVKSIVGLSKKGLGSENTSVVRILPKPSKMRIEFLSLKRSYFTNELVTLDVHVINEEQTDADILLELRLHGHSGTIPDINLVSEGSSSESPTQNISYQGVGNDSGKLYTMSIGQLALAEAREMKILLQAESEAAEYVLEMKALYHLLSDPDTLITKIVEIELVFVRPFEVNYGLVPRIHLAPWPSYFNVDDCEDSSESASKYVGATGLCQNWSLTAKIASFGTEAINIENVRLGMVSEPDDATCKIYPAAGSIQGEAVIMPADLHKRKFDLEVQKYSLEDSQPTALDLQIEIQWRRESPRASSTVSHVAVPELIIPFGEPRVLAVAKTEQQNGLIYLEYTIENPSKYVLSFDLGMETSEEFAFSGAKAISLQLVPLARHTVRYSLLPLMTGRWISPQFRAVDLHFNKTLKIHAIDGYSSDSKGSYIWVD
ncbi:hypothetical protein MMC07_007388 [Pseudocyphellaria aurata]|nr:hypothetical protein [Pseudocyphellaria aurata]